MTKPASVIFLFLSPLLTFAGCGGERTKAEASRGEIAPRVRPTAAEQDRRDIDATEEGAPGPVTGESEDSVKTATDAAGRMVAIPEMAGQQPVETPQTETREPNGPDLPILPPETQVTGADLLEQPATAEPNRAEVSEPETLEPNETPLTSPKRGTEAEPLPEPPAGTGATEARPLAGFYEGYAEILNEYVLRDGRIDFGSLRRKRLRLKRLLNEPDELDPNVYKSWSEDEKLAFWINTYNLKMLEIIARNYPIQSSWWLRLTWPPSDIRHIGGIWSDYRFIVMDEEFTLGDVERRIFRRTFGDPRVYLAIAYGCRSGPWLRRTPYRGDRLDSQLDEQVRRFLADGGGFRIDRDKRVVYLSALFKPSWRGKEFLGRYAMDRKFKDRPAETRAVLNFLTQYLSRDNVHFLEVENHTIAYPNFDWRISDSAGAHVP